MVSDCGNSGNAYLSLRLSCDRCRLQKLKCSVPAGAKTCQRCTRARVPCIFGRRSASSAKSSCKRKDKEHDRLSTPPSQTSNEADAGIITPPVSTVSTMSPPLLPCTNMSNVKYDLTNDNGSLGDDTVSMKLLGVNLDHSKGVDDGFTFDWLQPFEMDASNTFDVEHAQANFTFESSPSSLGSYQMHQLPTDAMVVDNIAATSLSGDQRLMSLVAEIQQQLWKLEQLPWNAESSHCSLETYPIGSILDLSRQFRDTVEVTFNNSSQSGIGGDQHNSNTSPAAPTILLVMCGYIWLMRLYNIVLDDFKRHLNYIPGEQGADGRAHGIGNRTITGDLGGGNTTPGGTSTLRWGDLTSIDAAIGLHQMSNAVRMMLSMLQEIESKLGNGAAAARDTAMIMLINLGRMQESSSDGFSQKATFVKNLLRERIGL